MKNVIIIHGSPDQTEYYSTEHPSPSNSLWIPWLQKQLTLSDVISVAPEMPKPYDPIYSEYLGTFKDYTITNETILIGHSSGGGFLLRYLSENPSLVPAKVILVAPWIDPGKELTTPFFDFEIDSQLPDRTDVHLFQSSDDSETCISSFEIIERSLSNITYHKFEDRGHFKIKEFDELLAVFL